MRAIWSDKAAQREEVEGGEVLMQRSGVDVAEVNTPWSVMRQETGSERMLLLLLSFGRTGISVKKLSRLKRR